jgi:hypothetical protein
MSTTCSLPGGKVARVWSQLPTPIQCQGQECMELHFHSPNTSPWHSTQLSTGTTLPFYLLLNIYTSEESSWCTPPVNWQPWLFDTVYVGYQPYLIIIQPKVRKLNGTSTQTRRNRDTTMTETLCTHKAFFMFKQSYRSHEVIASVCVFMVTCQLFSIHFVVVS